jgi:hypothetical protein
MVAITLFVVTEPNPPTEWPLVRIVVEPLVRRRDADPVEQVDRALLGHRLRCVVVHQVGLGQLVADPVERVHRRQGVLEDHRDLPAAQGPHLGHGHPDELRAVQPDLAGHLGPAALVQAHDRQAGHTLAGAGLADDAERLAALQGEAQPVDGLHQAVVGREVHLQVVDLQERLPRAGLCRRRTGHGFGHHATFLRPAARAGR